MRVKIALAILRLMFLVALVILGTLFMLKPKKTFVIQPAPESGAVAQYEDGNFTVSNKGSFIWNEANLKVNETYSCVLPCMKPGDTITIKAGELIGVLGSPLDPESDPPRRYEVECKTDKGILIKDGDFWLEKLQEP